MNRESATLIILAGGEGRRMGFPKHELAVGETNILERIHQRIGSLFQETVVVGRGISTSLPSIRTAEDCYLKRGAVVGIHAGLSASRTDLTFVVACDMPHIERMLVSHMLGLVVNADIVVPIIRGYNEPLCAVYRRTCLPPIEHSIEAGILKIIHFYSEVRVREIPEHEIRQFDPALRSFINLNTPEERKLAASLDVFSSVRKPS